MKFNLNADLSIKGNPVVDEIYVGEGDMPEGATLQVVLDGDESEINPDGAPSFTKISVYKDLPRESVENITEAGKYIFDLYFMCGPCGEESTATAEIDIGEEIGVPYYSNNIIDLHSYGLWGDCFSPQGKLVIKRTSSTEFDWGFYITYDTDGATESYVDDDGIAWGDNTYFGSEPSEMFSWTIYKQDSLLIDRANYDDIIDDELSVTSTRPVQNKVVKEAIDKVKPSSISSGWDWYDYGSDMMYNQHLEQGLYVIEVTNEGEWDSMLEEYTRNLLGSAVVYVPSNLYFRVSFGDFAVVQEGEGGLHYEIDGWSDDGSSMNARLEYKKLF